MDEQASRRLSIPVFNDSVSTEANLGQYENRLLSFRFTEPLMQPPNLGSLSSKRQTTQHPRLSAVPSLI